MKQRDEIQLFLDGDTWHVRYLGSLAKTIRSMFGGSDVLPTPFRAAMDGEKVRAAISDNWPGVPVVLVASESAVLA